VPFLSIAHIFGCRSCPSSGRVTLFLAFLLLSFAPLFLQLFFSPESHVMMRMYPTD